MKILFPDPFSKKKKIKIKHISESVYYSFIQLVFIVCQVDDYQNILKLSCRPLAFTTYKAFLKKQNEVWNLSPCLIFCMIFEEYFICYILLLDQILLSGCLYL